MITKPIIKTIINKRLDDVNVLIANRRYAAAIYLCGYAIELSLKYKICKIMQFGSGFPETPAEFQSYYSSTRRVTLRATIRQLKDIKHHRFSDLLAYSGEQINIQTNYLSEWNIVNSWTPEMRYNAAVIRKQTAKAFVTAAKTLVNELV